MTERANDTRERISVGEIASLAGVVSSAVSNWRTRHADFPSPLERAPGGDLFDAHAIRSWLESRGKLQGTDLSDPGQLHEFVGAKLRQSGQLIDHSVLIILQALYLANVRPPGSRLESVASQSDQINDADIFVIWRDDAARAAASSELARALELPSGTDRWDIKAAIKFVSAITQSGADAGALATSILRHHEEWQGLRGSDATTGEQTTALMLRLLEPIAGSVYDPAAGSAMVLADAWRNRSSDQVQLFGQEISEYHWQMGYLHLTLCRANFKLFMGDTLLADALRSEKMDRIAADLPFLPDRSAAQLSRDERWRFGVNAKTPQWMWVQHVLYHLTDQGIGVVSLPAAALYRSGDASVRQALVESGYLDAIIDLPQGLGSRTSAGLALLVLDKSRGDRRDKVLFVNARKRGESRRGKSHVLGSDDLAEIQNTLNSWRNGVFESEPQFAGSAQVDDILSARSDLSPQRYIGSLSTIGPSDHADVQATLASSAGRVRREASRAGASVAAISEGIESLSLPSPTKARIVKLRDILAVRPRTGVRQTSQGGGRQLPYVQTGLVSKGNGHLVEPPEDRTYEAVSGRTASRGDLLLVARGLGENTGGCSIVDFDADAAYSQSLICLSVARDRVDPDYLRTFLTSSTGRAALAAATTGSVIGNLRIEALVELEIPMPPLAYQREVSTLMNQFEREMKTLSNFVAGTSGTIDALRNAIAIGAPLDLRTEGNQS